MNFESEPYNLRLATRSSPLALAQAEQTVKALTTAHSGLAKKLDVKIKNYRTTGDRIESGKLSAIGGKGLFTKEIEQALISNDADLA
ncbi:MAG: hydroxymethylbilane synthase, partial [Alphaproteobacteria bacterium]